MSEGKECWVIRLGNLYLGGLGKSFINDSCIGFVMTKLRKFAEEFQTLESATTVARAVGGQVLKG